MNKQEVIDRFQREVTVQEERLRANKQRVEELCQQLGYNPNTVTIEQVKADLEEKKQLQSKAESELQELVNNYDRNFSEK